jgi:hypothetical protein
VRRAIALQKRSEDLAKLHDKVYAARRRAADRFERIHEKTIRNYAFEQGDLVLMQNTRIEKLRVLNVVKNCSLSFQKIVTFLID